MGANLVRAFRNFNVESRAHRLIGKDKPSAAPAHPGTREAIGAVLSNHPGIQDKIYKKDDQLLSRLKDVYVDSTDPSPQVKEGAPLPKQEDLRPLKHMMRNETFGITVDNVPKGKISIVEALFVLSNHKKSPETWTAEKIAGEYNLDIKDTKDMLEFFTPFDIKIVTPNDKEKIAEK
ncbi:NADH dehydrogenase [ubiquinone] 1 alpha subcomplex assembly factor 4 [Bufo gargarizans]|uniref:NADH dehydrogenase [ubiquinone] 1 alpha subcomplex assembly factor 4 n=1 Tax=Bufo gargarizans TaxID=30331 RepID=UPI001CF52180|nr:NADH dehydrogenase [ubiquinone] 1 alpha subcomplex assembly factor 4 [Bufo gargarizans]